MRFLNHPPYPLPHHHGDSFAVSLTWDELGSLRAALMIVLSAIDPIEFHTRLGVEPQAADALLVRLAEHGGDDRTPRHSDEIMVKMAEGDLLLANNALNEVVNGLREHETGLRSRTEKDRFGALLTEANAMFDAVVGVVPAP